MSKSTVDSAGDLDASTYSSGSGQYGFVFHLIAVAAAAWLTKLNREPSKKTWNETAAARRLSFFIGADNPASRGSKLRTLRNMLRFEVTPVTLAQVTHTVLY